MKLRHFLKVVCPVVLLLTLAICFTACNRTEKDEPLFQEKTPEQTGITFSNTVVQSGENNVLNYSYYFNGGGVAVGDINNDGLVNVYFSRNQVSNKFYLNKGNFQFENITDRAGVSAAIGWKTGVTMADVNLDGRLDIYVCRSAMADSTLRENLLYINVKPAILINVRNRHPQSCQPMPLPRRSRASC